jgi:D-tyrosyl-tRNA(Tyr) deacylase
MNLSVVEAGGNVIVVSQFTLLADWKKGRRPGFTKAAAPKEGERLYLHFVEELKKRGLSVGTGVFGAHMEVSLVNSGPVTLLLESRDGKPV